MIQFYRNSHQADMVLSFSVKTRFRRPAFLSYYKYHIDIFFRLQYSQFCLVQPNTDIFSYLAKHFRENKNLTCKKCTTQFCQSLRTSYQEMPNILFIQTLINRFSTHIVE